jgi:hypothetical protein
MVITPFKDTELNRGKATLPSFDRDATPSIEERMLKELWIYI